MTGCTLGDGVQVLSRVWRNNTKDVQSRNYFNVIDDGEGDAVRDLFNKVADELEDFE